MIIDPLYLVLLAPGLLLAVWAQWKVRGAYAKAQQMPASMSGAQAARRILDDAGLERARIDFAHGYLSIVSNRNAAVVKQVLDAAALTYVAATVSAILTLLYMLIRSGLLGGRR